MRKYYNEFNEEYERGYRAGRREALRESKDDFLSFEEVNDIIFKTAKKYGLKATRHNSKELYSINIEHVGNLHFYSDKDLTSMDLTERSIVCTVSIEGAFNSGSNEKDIRRFADKIKQINAILNVWKELDSIDLTYKMFL